MEKNYLIAEALGGGHAPDNFLNTALFKNFKIV
jgi:hypothetical protein